MKKKMNKKGFTLAELLIVIAIIAILAAIAIPVFSAQLNKAEEAVAKANIRAASSMAVADYMLSGSTTGDTYYYNIDRNSNLTKVASSAKANPYVEVTVANGGNITTATYTDKDGETTTVTPE